MYWKLFIILSLSTPQAFAVSLQLDLSRFFASSTCDWDTVAGRLRSPLTNQASTETLNFGDGSDGECHFGTGTYSARVYHCRNLTVSGNARFTGTDALIFRVQGSTLINGSLNVSGFSGSAPAGSVAVAGGVAGPAGFAGGEVDNLGLGSAGETMFDGGGDAGLDGFSAPAEEAGGGGGAGGNHGETLNAQNGSDGTGTAVASTPGTGGTTSAANTNYNQSNFENPANFRGGSGGGAGGVGWISNDQQFYGASGGGGGGVVRILSRRNITVNGSIVANGGDGGSHDTIAGAGGGGAGGNIWLQTSGELINNGTIQAKGGAGGVNNRAGFKGGNGGAGGDGRIRVDTLSGASTGNNSDPLPKLSHLGFGIYQLRFDTVACSAQTTAIDTIGLRNNFKSTSTTETLNGGAITIEVSESDDGASWSAAIPLSNIDQLNQRYLRFDFALSAGSALASPILEAINVEYDIEEKSDVVFKSDVSCGTTGGPDQKNELFTSVFLGILLGLSVLKRKPRPHI